MIILFTLLFIAIFIIFIAFINNNINHSIEESLYGSDSYNRNKIVDFLTLKIRRYKAFKVCKAFLRKENGYYKLRNKNLMLIYDYKHKIIKCYENTNRKRVTTLNWYEQGSIETFCIDNLFEETFDNICYSFNSNSSYDKIVAALQYYFATEEVETRKGTKVETPSSPNLSDEVLDINEATEEEFTNLPGINRINAKKIVEYRDLHCGFKTVEEFYQEMKIKPHFQKQLDTLICIKEYKIKDSQQTENERILDL